MYVRIEGGRGGVGGSDRERQWSKTDKDAHRARIV